MSNCTNCGVEKTLENTYLVKPKSGVNYLRSRCNSCHSSMQREYNAKNKDAVNKKSREWRRRNPARHTYLTNMYKRHVKIATPRWLSAAHFDEISYKYLMAREAKLITGDDYHVDHIIPLRGLNVCGLHVPWNLQVLPSDMNLAKSNRTVV